MPDAPDNPLAARCVIEPNAEGKFFYVLHAFEAQSDPVGPFDTETEAEAHFVTSLDTALTKLLEEVLLS